LGEVVLVEASVKSPTQFGDVGVGEVVVDVKAATATGAATSATSATSAAANQRRGSARHRGWGSVSSFWREAGVDFVAIT
jgi:hypothetical protein